MIVKLLGLVILLGSLGCVYLFEGSSMMTGALRIFHWPALILTGIGPLGLVLMCADWGVLARILSAVFGPSPRFRQIRQERDALFLQKIGKAFYSDGAQVFETVKARNLTEPVQKIVDRLAVRMPTADIRELMESERDRKFARVLQCINVLGLGVRLAPSVGMLGTILGMVQLLNTLQDPTHIGSHMSLALLTTFYGLFFSLVFWTPLQQRMERALDVQTEGYNQVVQWLEFLEKRKPSNYFADTADLPNGGQDAAPKRKAA